MTTILLVTAGNYSDYKAVAVFDVEHRAQAEALARHLDLGDVLEMELNPDIPEPVRQGLSLCRVEMKYNGEADFLLDLEWEPGEDPRLTASHKFIKTKDSKRIGGYPGGYWWYSDEYYIMVVTTWARDREHAVKIANERRVQAIAMNEWPEPWEPSEKPPPDPEPERPQGNVVAFVKFS